MDINSPLPPTRLDLIRSAVKLNPGDREGAEADRAALLAEVDRLNALINTPHTREFLEAVKLEMPHQRERWGAAHDAGKTPADWFWLVGYLAGKALHQSHGGDPEKAKHHIITTASALGNWFLAVTGESTSMRPGSETPAGEPE